MAEAVLIIVWSPRWLFRVHAGPAVLITVWGSRCLGSLSNYQTRRPVLFPVRGPRLQPYIRTTRRGGGEDDDDEDEEKEDDVFYCVKAKG